MIKPEELRFGDLVRVCCDCAFPKDSVCTVNQIYSKQFYKVTKGIVTLASADDSEAGPLIVFCSDIEGIPLTPEILEKNDFKTIDPKRGYTQSMGDTSRVLKRYISIERKSRDWAVFLKYESFYDYVLIRHIQCIHELQYLLFGLGINHEMEV